MSAPWFKFFPTSWRADPALRMCSIAARGLWMEMLCVMHEAEPRGFLVINGASVNERQLAALAGISIKDAAPLVEELEAAGVFSRDSHGAIFSRRMRRDDEKAERDKANGRSGGNPQLKGGVNPTVNGHANHTVNEPNNALDKAKKLEVRGKKESIYGPNSPGDAFDRFWSAYPRRKGENPSKPARDKFAAAVKSGVDPKAIITGAARYARQLADQGKVGTEFVAQAMTWLNQRRWQDYADSDVSPAVHAGHWIANDSPEWTAWTKHRGKPFPLDKQGGWTAPSQWPPAGDSTDQRQTEVAE